uniref:Uncharacterized protein n=1 Tax=Romanomermis culicivorax TaxID=13658 RepID=A0A915JF70_ROMCU
MIKLAENRIRRIRGYREGLTEIPRRCDEPEFAKQYSGNRDGRGIGSNALFGERGILLIIRGMDHHGIGTFGKLEH